MILVLQSRADQSGPHELKCIYQASGLKYNDILALNFGADFVAPKMIRDACRKADGIIIGGLGEVGYGEQGTEKAKWFQRIRDKILPVIAEVIKDKDTKMLGICLGHQLIAEAMGTPVDASPEQTELGVTQISLTNAGQKDPLFDDIPAKFLAIEGHRDAVIQLPKETVHLATSEKCPIQAFRSGKFIYGVQFHPELNKEEYTYRTSLYSAYSENGSNDKAALNDELTTDLIIKNFLKLTRF